MLEIIGLVVLLLIFPLPTIGFLVGGGIGACVGLVVQLFVGAE